MFKVAVADLPEPEPPLTESIAVGWRPGFSAVLGGQSSLRVRILGVGKEWA